MSPSKLKQDEVVLMPVEVMTWYLEMLSADELRPSFSDRPDLDIIQAKIASPDFSRFLYTSVGGHLHWRDRLKWSRPQWLAYLQRPEVQTWVAYVSGTPAGYIELEMQAAHAVEIAYFGLLPQFIGQRIGGHLLSAGVQNAWNMGAQRVWVHTCSLDGPHALRNYESRGFRIYKSETQMEDLSAPIPAPDWT